MGSTIVFGDQVAVALDSSDRAATGWLLELFGPALVPAEGGQVDAWQVALSVSAEPHAELGGARPSSTERRPCFALDHHVVALPTWEEGADVILDDSERSCFIRARPGRIELIGHPLRHRWRFTAALVLYELVAARLGATRLEVHAAAVHAPAGALVLVGPKGAGKTTLHLALVRSGLCRPIANDRAFLARTADGAAVHGMPTPVKIRASTLAGFPELTRELPAVERPYLHTLEELARRDGGPPGNEELALAPAYVAARLGAEPVGSAPVAALLFPEVTPDRDDFDLTPMGPEQVRDGLWRNLYGHPLERTEATLFEELDGGRRMPSADLAAAIAEAVPGYRLLLGHDCYSDPDFPGRLLAAVR